MSNGEAPLEQGDEGLSPEALAERVYERVAEDESLRGDLTDEGFGPLLDWCANRIVSVVQHHSTPSLDELSEVFRGTMAMLVASAEHGDPGELTALPAEIVDPSCVEELSRIVSEVADPDSRAAMLAARLREECP